MREPLPSYDELPAVEGGGRSAWGLFDDAGVSVGKMALLTPELAADATRLVRTGSVFPLDARLDFIDPPLFERDRLSVRMDQVRDGKGLDETYFGYNPQASSQWDALGHVAFRKDEFYNGATLDQVLSGERNTITAWASRGIVTRGVLLDLRRTLGDTYDPGTSHGFTVEDLERARVAAGVEFAPGDVVLIRTGFLEWYGSLDEREREHIADRQVLRACGIEHTEEMARYAWNSHAVAFVSDSPSLEPWPMDHSPELFPFGCLHQLLLAQFGMAIGELWWLEDLAAACAADGRYEFLLTSAPVQNPKGIGSPANALAIR